METSTVDSEEIAPARESATRAPTVAVKPHPKGCPRSIMIRRCGARWAAAGSTAGTGVTTGVDAAAGAVASSAGESDSSEAGGAVSDMAEH